MQIDPFFQIPQHTLETPSGPAELPILLKEGDYSVFLFMVDKPLVDELLQRTGLRPAMNLGKKTFLALVMGHYSSCSVAPFSFVSLAVSVEREQGFRPTSPWRELFSRADRRHMGFHFLSCPVDNVRLSSVGKLAWGFPHSVSHISYRQEGSSIQAVARCAESNETFLQVRSKSLPFFRIDSMDFTMFSVLDNKIIRTLFPTRCKFTLNVPISFKLRTGDSQHPMSNIIRKLNLENKKPFLCLSTPCFQGRIDTGIVVEDLDS
ncbi:hypothetical protein [Ketobacter alkanivorans]|uniref:Acetoacetate decarboxylase n=1 Tax=Ketobacter alkanivorans TaxID=1917421 RepID=A0A2K9LIE7_9GAMM|nr:hypothetical protein [Ketobacter alkanivorans]AUM12128.1 hypothetical protein Kalk_06755 [Ketobacter alkanivorans]MCP5016419.1 hypothetical protein [Ketobacter sp.]